MKPYLNEGQSEDELVEIKAYDWQRILDGMGDPSIYMSDNVVPISKAVERIEEYLAAMKDRGAITDQVYFIVRACKDDFFLFRYDAEKGIKEDHRSEERPKSPERAYFEMKAATEEGYIRLSCTEETYEEFAVRDMEKMLGAFDIEKERKWKRKENIRWEDIYFDVYKKFYIVPYDYMYSYKDGKKYIRPLTENEKGTEKVFERYKDILLKVLIDDENPPRVLVEQETQANRAVYHMNCYKDEVKKIIAEKREQGEESEHALEDVFFQLYDKKTGALWKTYRIKDDKIEEDTSEPKGWGSLAFMKTGQ